MAEIDSERTNSGNRTQSVQLLPRIVMKLMFLSSIPSRRKLQFPLRHSLFIRDSYFFTIRSALLSDMFKQNAAGAKYNTFTSVPDNRRPSVEVIAARRSCILDLLASVSNK
jgi:hypothetical protein